MLLAFVAALLVAAPAPKPLASYCSPTFGAPKPGVNLVTWRLGTGPLGPTLRVRV